MNLTICTKCDINYRQVILFDLSPNSAQPIKELHSGSDFFWWKVVPICCSEKLAVKKKKPWQHSLVFLVVLSFIYQIHLFSPTRGSNYFKTGTIGRANQWGHEVTWLTYHKKWALFSSFFLPVCADCRWGVIVLSACLGLQHPLKSWRFHLWMVGSSFTYWHAPPNATNLESNRLLRRRWNKSQALFMIQRERIRIFLASLTETSLCPTYNVFHTAISWQLITCLQHNRGNLTFIRLYHMRR